MIQRLAAQRRLLAVALLIILSTMALSPLAAHSQDLEVEYPLTFGDLGTDQGQSVVMDGQRNAYVAGVFQGTVQFEDLSVTSEGQFDIFLAKFNADAQLIWVTSAGGISNDTAWSIALDDSNNIYMTGEFSETATFMDAEPVESDPPTTLTSAGSTDIFIAKYDTNGHLVWAKSAGGSRADTARAIAIDEMGFGVITGSARGSVRFDNIRLSLSNDIPGMYVAKFNSDGRFLWVESASGTGNMLGMSIGTDLPGNVYVLGEFYNTATFEDITLDSAGENDIFMVRYMPDGRLDWAERAGGEGNDTAGDLLVRMGGELYITGSISSTADFDGMAASHVGDRDIYVAHYNGDGVIQWLRSAGSGGADSGTAVSLSSTNGIVVAGRFERTWELDGNILSSFGGTDIFLFHYDLDGDLIWARTAGGPGSDSARDVFTDNNGVSVVTGFFSDDAEFDGVTRSSAGGLDIFVVRYDMFGFLLP